MNLESILAFLTPFAPLLKSELLALDASAVAELNTLIEGVSSP